MDENERSGDIGDGSGDILVMVTVLMVMDLVTFFTTIKFSKSGSLLHIKRSKYMLKCALF